jgi:hypothetical protein
MSVLHPNQPSYGGGDTCHVCGKPVDITDFGIEHDGHVHAYHSDDPSAVYGAILLHAECATVLAMRLIHDVMQQDKRTEQTPLRAVEVLGHNRRKQNGN